MDTCRCRDTYALNALPNWHRQLKMGSSKKSEIAVSCIYDFPIMQNATHTSFLVFPQMETIKRSKQRYRLRDG